MTSRNALKRAPRVAATTMCAAVAVSLLSIGCSKASLTGPSDEGGPSQASVAVRITGSPFAGVKAMLVTFSQLSLRRASGDWVSLTFANGATRTCDLARLLGPSDALAVGAMPSGAFNALRVEVSSVTLYFDKATTGPACAPAIDAPAGQKAAVQLTSREGLVNHSFVVGPAATTVTVMVDGDQSIDQSDARFYGGAGDTLPRFPTKPPVYLMTPVIRIVG